MKVGSGGMHLHLVCIEPGIQSETALAIARTEAISTLEDQDMTVYGIHSEQWWHNDRTALMKMLRARIKSGTYRVDSMALAECILEGEVHPLLS